MATLLTGKHGDPIFAQHFADDPGERVLVAQVLCARQRHEGLEVEHAAPQDGSGQVVGDADLTLGERVIFMYCCLNIF